jgi:plasmid stabilization system protein ParE
MTIVVTMPEADEQAERIDGWWRENRDKAPNLFREELERALQLLAIAPEAGIRYRRRRIPGLRRLVLPETRHHVYYVHDEALDTVFVLAVWGAIKRRGPPIKLP